MHPRHRENHLIERIGWLRAAVLGANDGIISTASLMVGVAAASSAASEALADGKLPELAPKIMEHLVTAEVRHFGSDQLKEAIAWAGAEYEAADADQDEAEAEAAS